jgi:hypothetical protein
MNIPSFADFPCFDASSFNQLRIAVNVYMDRPMCHKDEVVEDLCLAHDCFIHSLPHSSYERQLSN